MKKIANFSLIIFSVIPFISYAVDEFGNSVGFCGPSYLVLILKTLNSLVSFIILLAIIYFIWGVILHLKSVDDIGKKKGIKKIILGLIIFITDILLWVILGLLTCV